MLALACDTPKAGQVCHELIVIQTGLGPLDLGMKQHGRGEVKDFQHFTYEKNY